MILNTFDEVQPPTLQRDRILILGGLNPTGAPPGTLDTVDEFVPGLDPVAGTWPPSAKAPMGIPRAWLNAVVLPTGKILVVGGEFPHVPTPPPAGVSSEGYVFTPVLYDPGRSPTGAQAPVQSLAQPNPLVPRRNHSFAVLLPDGRVLVAGGDKTPSNPYPDSWLTGQIYEPPYLHQGFRPTITEIPASATLASTTPPTSPTLSVTAHLRAANSVERVVLLRPAATTHGFDNDQRLIELAFESETTMAYQVPSAPPMKVVQLTVSSPNESLGPQGNYMLFVLEKDAASSELVPSVAEFIDLQ